MQNAAIAINGRGLDLNDAFGNLGPFASDASDVLGTLRRQEQSLRTLVHDTGDVFDALTEHDQELAGAIVGREPHLRRARLPEPGALRHLPDPADLRERGPPHPGPAEGLRRGRPAGLPRPEAGRARPEPDAARRPRARSRRPAKLFRNLDPLTKASPDRAARRSGSFVRELRPVLDSLDPFLANLNPMVRWLDYQAPVVSDFLSNPSSATSDFMPFQPGQGAPLHLSRQMTIFTNESLSVYPQRLNTNRGNGYLQPFAIGSFFPTTQAEIFPDHDCDNTSSFQGGGSVTGGLGNGQVTRTPASSAAPVGKRPVPALLDRSAARRRATSTRILARTRTRPRCPPVAPPRSRPARSRRTSRECSGVARSRRCCPTRRFPAWPYFNDAQEVYDTIGKLFVGLAADEELGPKFRQANTIVQYAHRDPDSPITVRLMEDEPSDVDFGETEMEPEVVMSMEADTAHLFWLGRVNVPVALARGQIKASGPVAKILKLVPLTKPVYPRYKAQLEADGREDLVDVD